MGRQVKYSEGELMHMVNDYVAVKGTDNITYRAVAKFMNDNGVDISYNTFARNEEIRKYISDIESGTIKKLKDACYKSLDAKNLVMTTQSKKHLISKLEKYDETNRELVITASGTLSKYTRLTAENTILKEKLKKLESLKKRHEKKIKEMEERNKCLENENCYLKMKNLLMAKRNVKEVQK